VLASDGNNLKLVTLEDAAQDLGLIDETDAGCDSDFSKIHLLGKFADLLDTGPFAITSSLDQRRGL
jgi:hypothetical protein